MNPQKRVTFDTSASSTTKEDHVLINLDFGTAIPLSYVAILNHNMKTADAQFFVCANTSAIVLDNSRYLNKIVEMYLEKEKNHYEENPTKDHIYHS